MDDLQPHIRWMSQRDLPELIAIENNSFDHTRSQDDFLRCLQHQHCVGMVAEYEKCIAGFTVYNINKRHFQLLSIVTALEFRRRGVARQIIEKLTDKSSQQQRNRITCQVPERNMQAILFFRAVGFRAADMLKNDQEESDDVYIFEKQVS